jgi:hypothetical protein
MNRPYLTLLLMIAAGLVVGCGRGESEQVQQPEIVGGGAPAGGGEAALRARMEAERSAERERLMRDAAEDRPRHPDGQAAAELRAQMRAEGGRHQVDQEHTEALEAEARARQREELAAAALQDAKLKSRQARERVEKAKAERARLEAQAEEAAKSPKKR